MEILSNLTTYEIIYFVILIIFTLFFGFKGILQSLGFTLKIVGSITLPFMTYKTVLVSLSNYFSSNDFLNSLIIQYPLISEIVVFVIIFLLSYFIFGIFEKLLKINFVKNSTIKIIDFIQFWRMLHLGEFGGMANSLTGCADDLPTIWQHGKEAYRLGACRHWGPVRVTLK
jgi:hypothetical protein